LKPPEGSQAADSLLPASTIDGDVTAKPLNESIPV
jgi:hypothetical protein